MFRASQYARAVISLTQNHAVSLSLIVFAAPYWVPRRSTCERTHPVRVSIQFSVSHRNSYLVQCSIVLSLLVQSLSPIQLFATPWTAACQASLSITNSQSLLKPMSVSDAIQPSHPLLPPSPPAFNLSQHQGLFQ